MCALFLPRQRYLLVNTYPAEGSWQVAGGRDHASGTQTWEPSSPLPTNPFARSDSQLSVTTHTPTNTASSTNLPSRTALHLDDYPTAIHA